MIYTYLDLSTGHLTDGTRKQLELTADNPNRIRDTNWPAMTIAAYTYGWFVTVPTVMENDQMDALPSDLEEVLSYARDRGALVVRFDSDGDGVADLPFYEE